MNSLSVRVSTIKASENGINNSKLRLELLGFPSKYSHVKNGKFPLN